VLVPLVAVLLPWAEAFAQSPAAPPASAPSGAPATTTPAAPPPPSPAPPKPEGDLTRGEGMRAYQAAMAARRLGPQRAPTVEEFRERVADAEALLRANRTD